MSLYKAIIHGKEHRSKYLMNRSKWIFPSCANNRGCVWCQSNRLYKNKKRIEKAKYSERWEKNGEKES